MMMLHMHSYQSIITRRESSLHLLIHQQSDVCRGRRCHPLGPAPQNRGGNMLPRAEALSSGRSGAGQMPPISRMRPWTTEVSPHQGPRLTPTPTPQRRPCSSRQAERHLRVLTSGPLSVTRASATPQQASSSSGWATTDLVTLEEVQRAARLR